MDSEVKDALLKLIETGTDIAPHVVHDLLLWAKIKPLIFVPILVLFVVGFIYVLSQTVETEKINLTDVVGLISISGIVFFLIGFIFSIYSAIQAHFTPYAYLIDLIK